MPYDPWRIIEGRTMPFHAGGYSPEGRPPGSPLRVAGSFASLSGFAASLTILYLGMRGVLRLGGFVASGGPYEIAHPAPGWIWLVPVSILAGVSFVGLNFILGRSTGGLSLLVLAWPALFLSLGWNFLDFAFKPLSSGRGLVWAWLLCGVIFVAMGAIPAYFVLRAFARRFAVRDGGSERYPAGEKDIRHQGSARGGFILVQVLFLGLGIYAGILLFRAVAGS